MLLNAPAPSIAALQLQSTEKSSPTRSSHWEGRQSAGPVAENIPNDIRKPTLLMLRNLPNKYNKAQLITKLDSQGLHGHYNFVYVPTDFWTKSCFGYGFFNMVSHEDAIEAHDCFQGFKKWSVPSRKTCEVSWGRGLDNLQALIERYRNSPVTHQSVPEAFKPTLFRRGAPVAFPAPTRAIHPPSANNRRK